jgi:hypothetical protein
MKVEFEALVVFEIKELLIGLIIYNDRSCKR